MVKIGVEQLEKSTQFQEPSSEQGGIVPETSDSVPRTEQETKWLFYITNLRKFLDPKLYTFEIPPPPENLEDLDKPEYRKELAKRFDGKWLFRTNNRTEAVVFLQGLANDKILKLTDEQRELLNQDVHEIRSLTGTLTREEITMPKEPEEEAPKGTGIFQEKYIPKPSRLVAPEDMLLIRKSIEDAIKILEAMDLNKEEAA